MRAYVDAKEHAAETLRRDYTVDQKAKDYPKLDMPDPKREFELLWGEFCKARLLSDASRKKWEPCFHA